MNARIRLRRGIGFCALGLLLAVDAYATGMFGGSERTLAVVRSIVLPGLPFLEWSVPLGIAAIATTLFAVGAWLRWGVDWLPLLVMTTCVAVAAFVMPLHHHAAEPGLPPHAAPQHFDDGERQDDPGHHHHGASRGVPPSDTASGHWRVRVVKSSHEFTVVLVVFALLAQLRLMLDRLPGFDRLKRGLPAWMFFPAVDIARGAAVALLAGADRDSVRGRLADPGLLSRARNVNRWARFRPDSGDPLPHAHAPLRAAMSLAGLLEPAQLRTFIAESRAGLCGVPHSEPTWVRPLDGMLAALALAALGEHACTNRWRSTFASRFALRRGRRAAALHTPSMLSIGRMAIGEHAAATALARYAGWLGDEDWTVLRPHCLGLAASGGQDAQTLRVVAAGKLWARLTTDVEALQILNRRGVGEDMLARALEDLANHPRRESAAANIGLSER